MSDVVLLGIGNILLGDDGLGAWLAGTFAQRYRIPASLEVIEGGTLGLQLLDSIAGRKGLVVVDAVMVHDSRPGDVVRLAGDAIPMALGTELSTHDIALRDLLSAATLLGCMPDAVVLCGIHPAQVVPQISLSAPVRAALPALEKLVLGELARFGCVCAPFAPGAGPAPAETLELQGLSSRFV